MYQRILLNFTHILCPISHRQAYFRSYAAQTYRQIRVSNTQRTYHFVYACQNITVGNLDKPFTRPIPFFIWHITHTHTHAIPTVQYGIWPIVCLCTHKHTLLCSIFYIFCMLQTSNYHLAYPSPPLALNVLRKYSSTTNMPDSGFDDICTSTYITGEHARCPENYLYESYHVIRCHCGCCCYMVWSHTYEYNLQNRTTCIY